MKLSDVVSPILSRKQPSPKVQVTHLPLHHVKGPFLSSFLRESSISKCQSYRSPKARSMGQPRHGRRKAVVISSDDEDDENTAVEDILSDNEEDSEEKVTAMASVSGNKRTQNAMQRPVPAASTASKRIPATSQSQPSRAKSSKAKTNLPPAPEPKRGNKSIYSFFNAATQRQQSQPSVSPENSRASQDEFQEDILDDISGDDTSLMFSKGSNTALAVRKRKLQNDGFNNVGEVGLSSATQKFRKTSDGSKVPANMGVEGQRPWSDRFAPVNITELAVHKKKVQDVRNVLESALSSRAMPRLIVLKGPAGSAKTATINMLAKDLGADIVEWKNPAGAESSSGTFISASAQFEEFILRSGQFPGLQLISGNGLPVKEATSETKEDRPQIMVVEEFPNTFARSSTVLQSFRSTIQQFLATPRSSISRPTPLVMIISEALLSTSTASADSFTAHRLLGPQILAHPLTTDIEFNPIATTILTKALELIVVKEARKSGRRKTPGPQVLKHIAETGDIRSAISSLEFLCVKGDDGHLWSAKVAFTKSKGGKKDTALTKQEQDALKLISNRESSLGIFHAVGKVVYNKRLDPPQPAPQPPNHLPQHRKPRVPEVDVDVLINELGTDTSTFIAALHENYALSCNSTSTEDALDSLIGCVDALSDADLLSLDRFNFGTRAFSGSAQDNLRQDDMSFQTAVRGLLFALPSPVHRGDGGTGRKGDQFRMFYPRSLKIWKRKEEIEGNLDLVVQNLQASVGADHMPRLQGVKKEGVESWKRGSDFSTPAATADVDKEDTAAPLLSAISSSAKTEILLERLPYTAQIFSRRTDISPSLLSNITTLTSVQGDSLAIANLDDPQADDVDGAEAGGVSEWADAPDRESGRLSRHKALGKGVKKEELEGGGLQIPVEHAVEKLVLSDDDIED